MNSVSSTLVPNNHKLYFSKSELSKILNLYSIGVSKGNWKDYALNFKTNEAIFSFYKHTLALPDCTLSKFKEMLKGESYKMLIDHENHEVKQIFLSNEVAVFEVVIMDIDKKYFKFKWQVEKYLNIGPLENCWLTTVVSEPVPMGASI